MATEGLVQHRIDTTPPSILDFLFLVFSGNEKLISYFWLLMVGGAVSILIRYSQWQKTRTIFIICNFDK